MGEGFVYLQSIHGCKSPIYLAWRSMKKRCSNSNHEWFHRYGGRGISVCPEWKEYPAFLKWALGAGWEPGLTLDRRDNDSGYSPGNCRWATKKVQGRNTHTNKLSMETAKEIRKLKAAGVSAKELSTKFNIAYSHVFVVCRNEIWNE